MSPMGSCGLRVHCSRRVRWNAPLGAEEWGFGVFGSFEFSYGVL